MQGVDHLIYRLNDLREQSAQSFPEFRVYVVEGEKDANRLWSLGLPATTNDDGASENGRRPKWKRTHTQQLKTVGTTEVICFPDHDAAGRAHMQAAAQSCHAAGLAVRLVEFPGEHPKGYDVSDWLDAGHTVDELIALCEAAAVYRATRSRRTTGRTPTAETPIITHPRTLDEVHDVFSGWLGDDYDLDALDVVLAAAAAERLKGDPLWINLLSGPGNAKTETVQALSGIGAIASARSPAKARCSQPRRKESSQRMRPAACFGGSGIAAFWSSRISRRSSACRPTRERVCSLPCAKCMTVSGCATSALTAARRIRGRDGW